MSESSDISFLTGMKLFHRFRGKGSKILGIKACDGGMVVLLERGPYLFKNGSRKPRKISGDALSS